RRRDAHRDLRRGPGRRRRPRAQHRRRGGRRPAQFPLADGDDEGRQRLGRGHLRLRRVRRGWHRSQGGREVSTTKRRRIAGEPAPGPRAATTVAPEPAAAKKPAFLTGRDASQPAPPPPPATGTQQRSILRFWPWLVLLVGIAVAVVGALRFFGGEELDRSGAAGAATAATETIFSFTSDTLD